MKKLSTSALIFFGLFILVGFFMLRSWTSLPVKEDQNVFMPGTQPGEAGNAETPDKCDNCHGNYNPGVEPAYNWRGSMMAQAARDPLWLACLAVADQDSIWALGNPNAGDICIRCHSPVGWLEGRSDPTNASALKTQDFDGVQCDFCHRMIDPFTELGQPDVPADTDPTALDLADQTYQRDISALNTIKLFDGRSFLEPGANLPRYYESGSLPDYTESASGQYFIDPGNAKSGPFTDAAARHKMYYSRFHKSKMFCSTCHDVSNPILASVFLGASTPETQAAASYFHVERTSSEFLLSAYGRGGSEANIAGVSWADKCQDCHMRDVTGNGCNKRGAPMRDDLPLHDLTGGNQWISKILASADAKGPSYDPYNYAILSGQKHTGAQIDVAGIQGYGQALLDGASRALQQLKSAASIEVIDDGDSSVTLRVRNNSGHKLISGFPEGRRMFLNVKFYNDLGGLVGEINPYEPLVTSLDGSGNEVYVSGGVLTKTNDELVWEAEMSSGLTGETKSFHFALATGRYKDNRIPPRGFNTADMDARLAQPVVQGIDRADYFTHDEYAEGYDEVTFDKPTGTTSWVATLYYQTTSKEYIEFLRDEINGVAESLSSPTPSGEPQAYIVQDDPFFSNLKGWGSAIWDLWLHNAGAEPVVMAQVGAVYHPPCSIGVPQHLTATTGKRSATVSWDQVADAEGYNVYFYQGGKYTLKTTTQNTKVGSRKLKSGKTYCVAITAYRTCEDSTTIESDYSEVICVTPE